MYNTTAGQIRSAAPRSGFQGWGVGILVGLAVVAAGVVSIVNGPTVRAASENAIDLENQAVCSQLGMAPATSRYADCVAALAAVRANSARRSEQTIL